MRNVQNEVNKTNELVPKDTWSQRSGGLMSGMGWDKDDNLEIHAKHSAVWEMEEAICQWQNLTEEILMLAEKPKVQK
jgi:hypothetical protein